MMKYDLHIHSNISDGKLCRKDIINLAVSKNIEYISFTEHNCFSIVDKPEEINLINGIEFDTFYVQSFHTLYYFKKLNNDILNVIKKYSDNANERSELLVNNIRKIFGIPITIDELFNFSGKEIVTKRDIINWMIQNKYSSTVDEAANKFTNKNSRSYVQKYSLPFSDVAGLSGSNGYLFLAHPNTLKLTANGLDEFVRTLKVNGLSGVEVINNSKMDNDDTLILREIAKKNGLMTSGGSDFHRTSDNLGVFGDDSKELIRVLTK